MISNQQWVEIIRTWISANGIRTMLLGAYDELEKSMRLQIKLLSSRVDSPNNVEVFSLLYMGIVFGKIFIFYTDKFQIFLLPIWNVRKNSQN